MGKRARRAGRGGALVPAAELGTSLAVSGRIASGKTSLAERLSDTLGIRRVSFGSAVQSTLPCAPSPTRRQLQDRGQHIMEANGARWLLLRALELHGVAPGRGAGVVFDGVRHESMVSEIRRVSSASCLLFVDAAADVRLGRHMRRQRDGAAEAFGGIDGHRVEAELGRIRREADICVENSGGSLDSACAMIVRLLSAGGGVLQARRRAEGRGAREPWGGRRRGPGPSAAGARAPLRARPAPAREAPPSALGRAGRAGPSVASPRAARGE